MLKSHWPPIVVCVLGAAFLSFFGFLAYSETQEKRAIAQYIAGKEPLLAEAMLHEAGSVLDGFENGRLFERYHARKDQNLPLRKFLEECEGDVRNGIAQKTRKEVEAAQTDGEIEKRIASPPFKDLFEARRLLEEINRIQSEPATDRSRKFELLKAKLEPLLDKIQKK